jgi:hypothetical protein
VQGRSRPARSSGLLLALALLSLLAVIAPAAMAGERVQPPRELVHQYPLDAGKTRLKSGDSPATRPVAVRTSVTAAGNGDDEGSTLPGFLLIGLGLSALAAGAVWIMRAPSSPSEGAPGATPAPAAPLRAAASPATSRLRRKPRPRSANGGTPSRGGGSVKDQPALQQRIAAMRENGMTLQAIADTLNGEGIPTVRGGARWRPSSVQTAAGYKRPAPGEKQRPRAGRSASAR